MMRMRRVPTQDRGRCGDPVEPRHRDIADDDVWRQALGGADQRVAVLHVADHLELRLQQRPQQFGGGEMIVGEQQSGRYVMVKLMPRSLWPGAGGRKRGTTEGIAEKLPASGQENY